MHIVVDLDALDDLGAIGLEPTVEVVQVVDARELARRSVEELGGEVLAEDGVVALLLPAADQIVALLLDHVVEARDLVGAVLQVSVHRDDHVALGAGEAALQTGGLPIVAAELHAPHMGVLLAKLLDDAPGVVRATIVDEDDLVGEAMLLHHASDPCLELGQGFGFVI